MRQNHAQNAQILPLTAAPQYLLQKNSIDAQNVLKVACTTCQSTNTDKTLALTITLAYSTLTGGVLITLLEPMENNTFKFFWMTTPAMFGPFQLAGRRVGHRRIITSLAYKPSFVRSSAPTFAPR